MSSNHYDRKEHCQQNDNMKDQPSLTANNPPARARLWLFMCGVRTDIARARCYRDGRYVSWDLNVAIFYYRRAIKTQPSMRATIFFELASLYEQEKQDLQKAIPYFFSAALRAHPSARSSLQRLATTNNAEACCLMGRLCADKKSWRNAVNWYQQAATQKHADALYQLGRLYDMTSRSPTEEIPFPPDQEQALEYYQRAAKEYSTAAFAALAEHAPNDKQASYYLAQLYESVTGLNKDRTLHYYRQASDLGHVDAAFQLGQLYEEQAQRYEQDATASSEQNKNSACEFYAYFHKEARERTLHYYRQASDLGHVDAAFQLGQLYEEQAQRYEQDATASSEQNKKSACEFYLKAAAHSHQEARAHVEQLALELNDGAIYYKLGQLHHTLHHNDVMSAFSWYQRAYQAGHVQSLEHIHQLAQNKLTAAAKYMQELSDHDDQQASYYLGLLCAEKNAWQDAVKYYHQAAQKQHAEAYYQLGECYVMGRHSEDKAQIVRQDKKTGQHYYYQAALLDSTLALEALKKLANDNKEITAVIDLIRIYQKKEGPDHELTIYYDHKASELGNAASAFNLGQNYEHGDQDLPQDAKAACRHYVLAAQQGHKEAVGWCVQSLRTDPEACSHAGLHIPIIADEDPVLAYHIAQHYETVIGTAGNAHEQKQVCAYYLKAACQNYADAWQQTERCCQRYQHACSCYELARAYEDKRHDSIAALTWYKCAADHGHVQASERMTQLAERNRDCAYAAAQLYSEDKPQSRAQQCHYYREAIRQGHEQAGVELRTLAASTDNMEAQHSWALVCRDQNKNATEAAHYFLSVAQHEEGRDHEKACACYMEALKLTGDRTYNVPLDRLREVVTADTQCRLGAMYEQLNQKERARVCYERARLVNATAAERLRALEGASRKRATLSPAALKNRQLTLLRHPIAKPSANVHHPIAKPPAKVPTPSDDSNKEHAYCRPS